MKELAMALTFPLMCLGLVILLYGEVIVVAIAIRISGERTETAQKRPNSTKTNVNEKQTNNDYGKNNLG